MNIFLKETLDIYTKGITSFFPMKTFKALCLVEKSAQNRKNALGVQHIIDKSR